MARHSRMGCIPKERHSLVRKRIDQIQKGEATVEQASAEFGVPESFIESLVEEAFRRRPYRRVKAYRCQNPRCGQRVTLTPCPICRAVEGVIDARKSGHALALPCFWDQDD